MNKETKNYFFIGKKKYEYIISPHEDGKKTYLICEEAKISQYFPNEDIPEIIASLPDFVLEEMEFQKQTKNKVIRFRVSEEEKFRIEEKAQKKGLSTSDYLRAVSLS